MKAYAIKDPNGEILIYTIRSNEYTCKDQFSKYNWHIRELLGYRCVPVEITEIKSK